MEKTAGSKLKSNQEKNLYKYIIVARPENFHSKCPKAKFLQNPKTKQIFVSTCDSASCSNYRCRMNYRQSNYKAINQINQLNQFQFYSTLNFSRRKPCEPTFKLGWRKLTQKITYQVKKLREKNPQAYFYIKLFTDFTGKGADYNLLIWTNHFTTWQQCKRWFRPLIKKSFPKFNPRLYLQPPESIEAVNRYATGFVKSKNKCFRPPEEWRGKRQCLGSRAPQKGRTKNQLVKEFDKQQEELFLKEQHLLEKPEEKPELKKPKETTMKKPCPDEVLKFIEKDERWLPIIQDYCEDNNLELPEFFPEDKCFDSIIIDSGGFGYGYGYVGGNGGFSESYYGEGNGFGNRLGNGIGIPQ